MSQMEILSSKLRYQETMDILQKDIRQGRYLPMQRLPGLNDLSKSLNRSVPTVRRALLELQQQGIVTIRHGAGTFVTERAKGITRTVKIGLALSSYLLDMDKEHPTVGACLVGANQRCQPPDFIVQPIFFDYPITQTVGQLLLDEDISGLYIFEGRTDDGDFEFLKKHHIHVVYGSHTPREDGWTITLTNDQPKALSLAVEHLRSLGHRRIGFVDYLRGGEITSRHFGKLAFDHRLGNPNELLVLVDNPSHDTHWGDVGKFFAINSRPTAVIVYDEYLADVLLDGCERRGIKVPDDLSVVALQDAKPMGHRIPLTTFWTVEDIRRMASLAGDLLARRIAGQPIEHSHVIIEPKLMAKASTGPVSGRINEFGDNAKC